MPIWIANSLGKRRSDRAPVFSRTLPKQEPSSANRRVNSSQIRTAAFTYFFRRQFVHCRLGPAQAKQDITYCIQKHDAGGGLRNEKASGSSAEPTDYLPAGYVNRGRDGGGNVVTYEHD